MFVPTTFTLVLCCIILSKIHVMWWRETWARHLSWERPLFETTSTNTAGLFSDDWDILWIFSLTFQPQNFKAKLLFS